MSDATTAALALRRNWLPVAVYVLVLLGLLVTGVVACLGLVDGFGRVSAAQQQRDLLQSRVGGTAAKFSVLPPPASPFLEGATQTLAGAALQQRVVQAVEEAGGVVLSSQVALDSAQAAEGLIKLLVTCDLGQDDLQKALYDLEGGSPVLFVDHLVVQAAETTQARRLRVQLDLSGQWEGSR
jgi:general secretion pathway protein M